MAQPTPQEALIYVMVIASAADRDMGDAELARIGAMVRTLPAFEGFQQARILEVAQECQQLLNSKTGLEGALDSISEALLPESRETAYALAVDIVAADHTLSLEEVRILDILRERFRLNTDTVTAIELAASIRHRTVQ